MHQASIDEGVPGDQDPSISQGLHESLRIANHEIELRIGSVGDFRLGGNLRAQDVVGALEPFRESGGVLEYRGQANIMPEPVPVV